MLDIKLLRNDPDKILKSLSRKKDKFNLEKILELDTKRRNKLAIYEEKKNIQNNMNKNFASYINKENLINDAKTNMKILSDEIKQHEKEIAEIEKMLNTEMLAVPNIPDELVPDGETDNDNVVIKTWGDIRKFNSAPKPHWQLGNDLGILDQNTAAKISGSRFMLYKGLGALLERSLINFFIDTHTKNGYTEILPPYIANKESLIGVGQLPKFEEDVFKINSDNNYYLIPTAEVPLTNIYRNEILNESDLPKKFVAYTACFRSEAGSAGRDTRGLVRLHQFNKVELFKLTTDSNTKAELESLTLDAEKILQLLEIPYRVVRICIGDLGFAAALKNDIEVWMPSYNRYVEISSCSLFNDFQARRANIRYREHESKHTKFAHTLNGSGLAVGRTFAAILENYQNEDGSVNIPNILKSYMNTDKIG